MVIAPPRMVHVHTGLEPQSAIHSENCRGFVTVRVNTDPCGQSDRDCGVLHVETVRANGSWRRFVVNREEAER